MSKSSYISYRQHNIPDDSSEDDHVLDPTFEYKPSSMFWIPFLSTSHHQLRLTQTLWKVLVLMTSVNQSHQKKEISQHQKHKATEAKI